ncbi:MAG: MlaD family protein [Anaerohalosphaeraceae bacterium]
MMDYAAQQRRRNLIVGGFVLVALCAFFWMLMVFGDLPVAVGKMRSYEVLIEFPNAPGIGRDTPVQYCGYQIGRVLKVSPPVLVTDPNGRPIGHVVKAVCLIEEQYKDIPWNVDIKLMRRGLGSSYIEFTWDPQKPLVPKYPDNPQSVYLMDRMVLSGTTGLTSEFFPPEVQKKLENLVDAIAALATNANRIIGDADNQANIRKTLAAVSEATAQARDTLKSVQQFTDVGTEQLTRVADRLDTALAEFGRVFAQLNAGQGTAGRMLTDDRLYENLVDSTLELQMALEQIKKWAAEARDRGIRIKW